ncbi:MAG: protein kinase domain-containing protein, partial [Vicinamibacteraceae bacterium]
PEQPAPQNPTEARPNDTLPGGLVVKKRIGRGSTSVVFLVTRNDDGRELVLKIAASPEHNDRLRHEGAVLQELHHQHIVRIHGGVIDIAGHAALLMERAGERTLAKRLEEDGPLHLELLHRFGEDLLVAVNYLEQTGIPHRDIKPENIGVAQLGRHDRLHLVLFDFSLSRTSTESIHAGTVPYLDPFIVLRKPPRWDLAAERFAAAVTLYQMATARLPAWGDGRSDPAVLDEEVTLETGLFDPDLREAMSAFFKRTLRRDAAQRFDNADEMLVAWRGIFAGTDRVRAPVDEPADLDFSAAVAQATRDTPLAPLGLSTRALNALERQHVLAAGDLATLSSRRLYAMPGVGAKTRQEIRRVKDALWRRLATLEPMPTTQGSTTGDDTDEVISIDLLMARLMPRGKATDAGEARVLARFLAPSHDELPEEPWPTQSDVAQQLGLTRARVSQVVTRARARWVKDPSITRLRNDVFELVQSHGRVMTARELAQALLTMRVSEAPEPLRSIRALAVTRAAIEAERERSEPRFTEIRQQVLLVATDEEVGDYARRLGAKADELAASDPLLPPTRALDELQDVALPEGMSALPPARLVQLAAAASRQAAASSRLEIYPRNMPADRALQLAQGALLGAPKLTLTVDELRSRVVGRYPEAARLPGRPELDALLQQTDLGLEWDPQEAGGEGAYRPRLAAALAVTSSTTIRTRTTGAEATEPPEEVQRFDERLQYAIKHGSFLVLGVDPRLSPVGGAPAYAEISGDAGQRRR